MLKATQPHTLSKLYTCELYPRKLFQQSEQRLTGAWITHGLWALMWIFAFTQMGHCCKVLSRRVNWLDLHLARPSLLLCGEQAVGRRYGGRDGKELLANIRVARGWGLPAGADVGVDGQI